MVATPAPDADTLSASLRRLCAARWLVLGVMAVLVVVTDPLLGVPLPLLPMLLLIAIAAAQNGITLVRLGRGARVTASEFALQLWLDLGTLGALVFFSGGATNPLVSLLLPPVAIAALALPTAWVLTTGALAIAL